MRAKETQRYLLRATNTGISAVITPSGGLGAQTRLFERAVLTAEITPLAGATPYVRLGNAAPVGLAVLLIVIGVAAGVAGMGAMERVRAEAAALRVRSAHVRDDGRLLDRYLETGG